MAFRKLFFKRVNETRSNFVLAEGDIALDESTFKLFRGDGSTVGGIAISGLSGVNSISEDTSPSLGGDLDTNGNSIISASNANINIVPNGTGDVTLQTDTVQIGDSNTDATITTNGTGDLTLNTNSGTDSGSIVIADAANGNITITPNGSGQVVLDGLSFPTADGSANQVLQTDGSGNLSFATVLTDVVTDTTPQLGGDLDINGNDIVSTSNANIDIAPNGTGDILLKTNGSSGRVGMGTVGNPDTALHIKSSASIVTLQRTDDSKTPGISFQNSNGNTRGSVKIDGTGGTSNEIFMETYDGSSQAERFRVQHTGAKVTGILKIGDGSVTDNYAGFGDADDLKIFHNGSHSIIRETGTGSLYVQSDNNVIIGKDSGSETMVKGIADGAVELYYDNVKKLETTATGIAVTGTITGLTSISGDVTGSVFSDDSTVLVDGINATLNSSALTKPILFLDNEEAQFGTDNDMQIYHSGTSAFIKNTTGTLILQGPTVRIQDAGSSQTAISAADGIATLLFENSAKLTTNTNGILISGDLDLEDDNKIKIGTGDDLQIFHNGTNSIIQNSTGQLQLRGNTIRLLNAATDEDFAFFNDDGSVDLYYDNTKRFETTTTGIGVLGNARFDAGTEEAFHTVTGASGVTALDCSNGHIFYKTGCTGDITANFTNLVLTAEYATNLTVIINQGGTPYEVTALQIGGSAQTINWQGGSQPTGNANGIDAFSFTILNDGGTYVVLGQMVDFT